MLLTEFDEEKDYKIIAEGFKELWLEEGKEEGLKEGKKEGIDIGIKNLIDVLRELGFSSEQISSKIQQKFNISCDEANKYISEKIDN